MVRVAALVSAGAVLVTALDLAVTGRQADIDVYVTGGGHAFRSDLYSMRVQPFNLNFTYPPFAASVF